MVDYSKWNSLEVSDDEEELAKTPRIDKSSLSRFRHQSRLERMAEEKRTRETLAADIDRLRRLRAAQPSPALDDRIAALQDRIHRAAEPLNVDTLSRPGFDSSRVAKPDLPPSAGGTTLALPTTGQKLWVPEAEMEKMEAFLTAHKDSAEELAALAGGLAETCDFLLQRRALCTEEAVGFLHTHCLALALLPTPDDARLRRAVAQTMRLQYLVDSAAELRREARDEAHVRAFFDGFAGDGAMGTAFREESAQLLARVLARADDKRSEAAAKDDDHKAKADAQAAVLDSMPPQLADAFRAQDRAALHAAGLLLGPDKLQKNLDNAASVGLWRPN